MILAVLLAATNLGQAPPPLPTPDRVWSSNDYVAVTQAISSRRIKLPRLSDPNNGAFFRRLVDPQNLAVLRDQTKPIRIRMQEGMAIGDATRNLLRDYLGQVEHDSSLFPELAQWMCFNLYLAEATLDPAEAFFNSLPGDEKSQVRADGLKQMKVGIGQIFLAAELCLHEIDHYTPADRSAILNALAATIPHARQALRADQLATLQSKLDADRSLFSDGKDRQALDRIIAVLGK